MSAKTGMHSPSTFISTYQPKSNYSICLADVMVISMTRVRKEYFSFIMSYQQPDSRKAAVPSTTKPVPC